MEFLAEQLGVPKRAVRLLQGERSREKRVEVLGASEEALRALGGENT